MGQPDVAWVLGDRGDRTYAWSCVVRQSGQILNRYGGAFFLTIRPKAICSAASTALLGLLWAPLLSAAPLPAAAQAEIEALLGRLAASGCQFQRNGGWHAAGEAQAHLRRKLAYLAERGQVENAEHFIERAASRSSTSGQAYQVKCGKHPPVASAAWLRGELQALRAVRSE